MITQLFTATSGYFSQAPFSCYCSIIFKYRGKLSIISQNNCLTKLGKQGIRDIDLLKKNYICTRKKIYHESFIVKGSDTKSL